MHCFLRLTYLTYGQTLLAPVKQVTVWLVLASQLPTLMTVAHVLKPAHNGHLCLLPHVKRLMNSWMNSTVRCQWLREAQGVWTILVEEKDGVYRETDENEQQINKGRTLDLEGHVTHGGCHGDNASDNWCFKCHVQVCFGVCVCEWQNRPTCQLKIYFD